MTDRTPLLLDPRRAAERASFHAADRTPVGRGPLDAARAAHTTAHPTRRAGLLRRLVPAAVIAAGIASAGCASNPSRQDLGTVAGAVVGGVTGSALTGGSTFGTVGGAVAGGYVGRELSKSGRRR